MHFQPFFSCFGAFSKQIGDVGQPVHGDGQHSSRFSVPQTASKRKVTKPLSLSRQSGYDRFVEYARRASSNEKTKKTMKKVVLSSSKSTGKSSKLTGKSSKSTGKFSKSSEKAQEASEGDDFKRRTLQEFSTRLPNVCQVNATLHMLFFFL